MKELRCFRNLINYVQKQSPNFYKNIPDQVRQSSVSVIFRFKSENIHNTSKLSLDSLKTPYSIPNFLEYLNTLEVFQTNKASDLIELLFIARAVNLKDLHSGQISLPGGKADEQENDYETSIRETMEEVGVNLENKDSILYLGKSPLNIFAYYKNEKETRCAVHLYFMLNDKEKIKSSKDEVSKEIWVPLNYFLNPQAKKLSTFVHDKSPIHFISRSDKQWHSFIWKALFKDFQSLELPCVILPDGEILFGLTYSVMIHLLVIMANGEKDMINPNFIKLIEGLKYQKAVSMNDPLRFKAWFTEQIYYYQRIRQFYKY